MIDDLTTEARSNPRVGIIQLFGSSSGYVVSHAALGSNNCHLALIPEMDFSMTDVCTYMDKHLTEMFKDKKQDPFGIIAMAETAIPNDFEDYLDAPFVGLTEDEKNELMKFKKNHRRVIGQTPDLLRTAGLKIVHKVLQQYIKYVMGEKDISQMGPKAKFSRRRFYPSPYWKEYRVFTNEPRHTIRSIEPTVQDVAYGIRLGTMAVDTAMAGFTDCMVSQWLTEYVVVPLKLVTLGRKQMPCEGIFWRTVTSKTRQDTSTGLTKAFAKDNKH